MVAFVFGIILLVVGLIALVAAKKFGPLKLIIRGAGILLGLIGVVLTVVSFVYTQDVGQTVVQKSITGELVGQTTESGLHAKAPWVTALSYDVRNNTIAYIGGGESDHSGGSAQGPQVTFQDKDGVTADLDLVVRYSIVPTKAESIYSRYGTQEAFVSQVITNDVRSIARDVPAGFTTIELLNDRAEASLQIQKALEERWADDGIIVEAASIQEIRYPQDVKDRFSLAQNSRIEIDRATADKQRAVVEAETKVIQAQAEADANKIVAQSLTDGVLQLRYYEAIDKSTSVFVVPEGSQPLVNTTAPTGTGSSTAPATEQPNQ